MHFSSAFHFAGYCVYTFVSTIPHAYKSRCHLFVQGRLRIIAAPVCQRYCHKLERLRCPQREESPVEIHALGVIVAWFLAIGWLEYFNSRSRRQLAPWYTLDLLGTRSARSMYTYAQMHARQNVVM